MPCPEQSLSLQKQGSVSFPMIVQTSDPLTLPSFGDPPTAVSTGGEAPGAGEASVPQHAQEAHCMSPGPARGRGRQALRKCPPSTGQLKTWLQMTGVSLLGPCVVCLFTQPLLCLRIYLWCGSPSQLCLQPPPPSPGKVRSLPPSSSPPGAIQRLTRPHLRSHLQGSFNFAPIPTSTHS